MSKHGYYTFPNKMKQITNYIKHIKPTQIHPKE